MASLLTSQQLATVQRKPIESELSLKNLQLFYEEYLMSKIFVFEIDEPSQPVINLIFEADNLCHLMGFQHIFEGEQNATDYQGYDGYCKLENCEVTMDTFEEPRIKDKYKENRERILYFPFLYQLVTNPTVILFDPKKLDGKTKISTEFIFYNPVNNRYLHLGLDKHEGTNSYFPRTFFVRKKNDYIEDQTPVNVLNMQITV